MAPGCPAWPSATWALKRTSASCASQPKGTVTLAPGNAFDVVFTANATAFGTFNNPRSGGIAMVDPNDNVLESNEANNNATPNSVTITAPDLVATKTDNVNGATTLGNNF